MKTDCILCAGCADVCPAGCIEIIPFKDLTFTDRSQSVIVDGFESEKELPMDNRMVLIKHEAGCIRCGLCVKQCPVGVMVMTYAE